jgi:hypothetical protein
MTARICLSSRSMPRRDATRSYSKSLANVRLTAPKTTLG